MANVKLSPEVSAVLRRSSINGNSLTLPGQLDRSLYEQVNKVLVNAGGKWNRSAKAHIFTTDPRAKLGLALESGVSIDEKKQFQAFYTPAGLAARVVALADVQGRTVLEPSCGGGAILSEVMRAGARAAVGVELNPEAVAEVSKKSVAALSNVAIVEGDFLAETTDHLGIFERVVMNPPFTKNQDVKHVAHALKFLRPGGVLVAIMSPNTRRPAFERLLLEGRAEIFDVPPGTFKESGTEIATIILKLTTGRAS